MFECDISPSARRTDDVYDDLQRAVTLEINDMGNIFFFIEWVCSLFHAITFKSGVP